jgi:hypothetical protein
VLQKLSATSYDTGWLTLPSDFITSVTGPLAVASGNLSVNLSAYLPLAGGYITGDIQSLNGSEFRTFQSPNSAIIRPYQIQLGDAVGTLTVDAEGISFNSSPFKQTLPFLGLAGYATEGWVTANFYPLASNPSGFLTASALTPYSTTVQADALYYPLTGNPSGFLTSAPVASVAGKVGAVTLDNTDISGLGSLAVVNDAPSDGSTYGRNNGAWTVAGGGGSYLPLAGGALDADASVTASDTSTLTDSELAGWGLGVQLTADHTKGTTVEFNGLDTYDGASHMQVTPTGLTFPDSTTQTTAANPFDGGTVTNPIQHFNVVGDITFGVAGSSSYMMSVEDIGNTVRFDFGYNSISNYDANVGSVNVGLSHAGAVLTSNNPATLAYVVDGVRLDYSGLNFSLTAPGIIYARSTIYFQDSTQQSTAGIPEAPNDGNYYVRKNNAWYMCSTASVYDTSSNPVTVLTV